MMPMNAAPAQTAPAPSAAPGPQQVPPEIARHIDPNNPLQMTLLQRIDTLTPQDGQALQTGISPQAAAVLKKVIPEVGFLIDMIHAAPQGVGGAMPMGGGGAAPPRQQPPSRPRPTTQLSRF